MVVTERAIRDKADRKAIETDLDATLFVEAGAGSGKTTALVDRVLALLHAGVAMENIAAITFTEKAADELKNRLRLKLAESKRHPEALDQLDGAAITTLHGFALRILSQHAIEAELPPRIEVSPLDAFQDRWEETRTRLLYSADQKQALSLAQTMGINIGHLRGLAQTLDDNWDLVQERMGAESPAIGPVTLPDVSDVCRQLQAAADLAHHCLDDDDKMRLRLDEVGQWASRLAAALDDNEETTHVLFATKPPSFRVGRLGRRGNWPDDHPLDEVRGQVGELEAVVGETKQQIASAVIERLTLALAQFTLEAADDRRRRGVLEFHDLLVITRNLLRHPQHGSGVRAALAARYQRLLLDEFQDTDPLQIDLAKLIATPPEDTSSWTQLRDSPGRLFYVGDPKQSIYRFRRADIALFTEAGNASTVTRKSLTRNFRSAEPLLTWINGMFEGFMAPPAEHAEHVQPHYQGLDAVRGSPPHGPPVAVLNTEHPKGTSMATLRETEADEVAKAILTAVGQGWSVGDGRSENGEDLWRSARLQDICILLPSRTSLPQLEPTLQRHGIPYRIEAGSLIWASQAIREVMATVRALADPTDEVALVNALRSPAFGCGDDDLYTFKVVHQGRWNYQSPRPKPLLADHSVGEAMDWLAEQHRQVRWSSPSEVLERIVRERRLMESACFGHHRVRDVWRSLHLVIDQARQFEEAGGRGLREFVSWVERKIDERARETDVILSETDDDAVQITTVHASKGREFPIVILSGTHTKSRPMTSNLVWPRDGGFGVRFNNVLRTQVFAEHQDQEDQMDGAEKVRLLYVALTRAKDHLIVSAHRPESDDLNGDGNNSEASMAELVAANATNLPEAEWQPVALLPEAGADGIHQQVDDWRSRRDAALAAALRPLVMSASAIASPAEDADSEADDLPGLAKDGPSDGDDQRSPWRKGRYGTKVGSAVHGVLQTVDLDASPDRLGPVAEAQAEAEGVSEARSTVHALAKSALESHTVREAATTEHWKELFVAAPVEGTVVEGYIDLLYRTPDGLVVVDYKTDYIPDEDVDALEAKIDRYQYQLAAYSLAVEQSVGEEVARCVLVFARAGQQAREETISSDELADAQQEVLRRLAEAAA